MPRILVLGTGTSVGKTFVSVALARFLTGAGARVSAVKPIETGIRDRRSSDALTLEKASSLSPPAPHPLYALREPVSPHLAARRERRTISLSRIARWVEAHDTTLHYTTMDWVIVETAGGLLSPLSPKLTNLDLARALEPAIWILVAPDSLGVLHDVSASLSVLQHARRRPDFVVLTGARAPDVSTGTNAIELARLGIVKPAAVLLRGADPTARIASLGRALQRLSKTR